ncbi:MAG: Clostridium P-47 protein [Saliniramus fredricksonii]|uniref:p-47 protein n=1 Tax=Saliniramus fredricksonii TaxID=1653334 RepID=A0A0P7X689_9HYPH|nr:TULIP family P47-like protein [Saliniramus fredricksonii]KPQ10493.1 MAG: Clostridium P-47 protein [Saliniramus fredricksonii]SCC80024.1 P-47 protein [Saliniramus fredricksonii]
MSNTPNVDTYHWDTVYSASYDVVNAAIKKHNTFPASFSFNSPEGVDISGDWEDWELSVGGSGADIQMVCKVKSGSVTAMGQTGDLTGSQLRIQFNLESVVGSASHAFQDPTAKPGKGKPNVLQTRLTGEDGVSAISVLDTACTFPNLDPATFGLIIDALPGVFGKYFNANKADFKHVFHVMMINEEADKDAFTWIKPSAVGYAVAAPGTRPSSATSVFGALAMVDGGQIGPLQEPSVDVATLAGLPEGANSAFTISAAKFTRHLLLPGAIATIQGSKASDFTLSDSGLNITNANKLTWGHFDTGHGTHSPVIDAGNFLMRLDGDHVLVEITDAHFSPSAGITLHMNLTQRFSFKTVKRKDGKFVFIPDIKSFGNPSITTNVSVSRGMEISEIVIGSIGIVAAFAGGASGLASFLSDGAETAVTSTTEGVVTMSEDAVDTATSMLSDTEMDSVNDTAADSVDSGLAEADNPNFVQRGSFFKTTQFRTYAGLTAALTGIVAGSMALAKPLTQMRYDDIPAFDHFAANVLGASKWPMTSDYALLGASLRNALVCGIKLK